MKKKPAHEVIEELDMAMIKIVGACSVYKESPNCPDIIKPWFEHIIKIAKKGMGQK